MAHDELVAEISLLSEDAQDDLRQQLTEERKVRFSSNFVQFRPISWFHFVHFGNLDWLIVRLDLGAQAGRLATVGGRTGGFGAIPFLFLPFIYIKLDSFPT